MRRLHLGLWLAFAAALFVAFSRTTTSGGEKKDPIPTFNEEDDGKTYPLEKDGKMRINLKSNPTTGFRWQIIRNNPEQLKLLEKSKFLRPDKAPPGAGGSQLFEFQALEPGTSEIEMVYRRPFDKDVKPAKTFKLTLQIK